MFRLRFGLALTGAATFGALLGACTDFAGPIPTTAGAGGSTIGGGGLPPAAGGAPPVVNGSSGSGTVGGQGGTATVSFNAEVHPILLAKCGECHSGEDALPAHGATDPDEAFDATQGMSMGQPLYRRILARGSGNDPAGFMPPGYAGCEEALGAPGCLTQAEFDVIELWVEEGATNR